MSMDVEKLIEKWTFNWGVMDVLIGAKSSVDLDSLRFESWEEATNFVKHYGYDPDKSQDARQIHAIIIESIDFIARYLIPEKWHQGFIPPRKVLLADDVRDLLLLASNDNPKNSWEQAWACGVLRVMHTIAHMDSLNRVVDLDEAREQIMGRFRQHIFRDSENRLCFGVKNRFIFLNRVDWKNGKTRESIILKLLHKRANVAETIYDLLGIRIVTKHLADVMVAIKFLREFHLITFTNCNPSRSRNNLIDVDNFRHNIDTLRELLSDGRLTTEEFCDKVQKVTMPLKSVTSTNPHSNRNYRSVQLTCRHFVKFVDPSMAWRQKIEEFILDENLEADVRNRLTEVLFLSRNALQEWAGNHVMGFFPFEVHVLDEESFEKNTLGDANHDRYKLSQVRAARRRVLSRVLATKPPSNA